MQSSVIPKGKISSGHGLSYSPAGTYPLRWYRLFLGMTIKRSGWQLRALHPRKLSLVQINWGEVLENSFDCEEP